MDFRTTAYFPGHAFLHGVNPYDPAAYLSRYPGTNPFPPFAPLTLLLYAPLALLPLPIARGLWFVTTVTLTLVLAWWVLRRARVAPRVAAVVGVATLVLMSHPGEMNLVQGTQTMPLVLGSYAALVGARAHPLRAVVGVAIATCKPQFGIPLAVLLAAGGDLGVAAAGIALSGAVSLAVLYVMPPAAGASPLGTFIAALSATTTKIQGQGEVWWSQIDVPYLLGHLRGTAIGGVGELAVLLALLACGAAVAWRLARDRSDAADELRIGIASLTILLCVYHQVYDALLLALPLTLLATGRARPPWRDAPRTRLALAALLTLPAANYLATWNVLDRLGITGAWWRVATGLNAAALLVAWLLYVRTALDAQFAHDAAPKVR